MLSQQKTKTNRGPRFQTGVAARKTCLLFLLMICQIKRVGIFIGSYFLRVLLSFLITKLCNAYSLVLFGECVSVHVNVIDFQCFEWH